MNETTPCPHKYHDVECVKSIGHVGLHQNYNGVIEWSDAYSTNQGHADPLAAEPTPAPDPSSETVQVPVDLLKRFVEHSTIPFEDEAALKALLPKPKPRIVAVTAEQLADALHEKMVERADRDGEANVTINDLRALARDAYNLAQADLAAAQAVIEQAPHTEECRVYDMPENCYCWKSQSSSSALAAHDAEVWEAGFWLGNDAGIGFAHGFDRATAVGLESNPYRAQGLRDGQETT